MIGMGPITPLTWAGQIEAQKAARFAAECELGGTEIPCDRCFNDLASHPCRCTKDCGRAPCRNRPTLAWNEDWAFPAPIFDIEKKVQPRIWLNRYDERRERNEPNEEATE